MKRTEQWKWPEIVLASRNNDKVGEFRALFEQEFNLPVKGLNDFIHIPDVDEDRETFAANAVKKAEAVSSHVHLPVVGDDSGLVVDALDGAPGIYSARYAGAHGDDAANNRKLLAEMADVPAGKRSAKFVCALALVIPGWDPIVVHGECAGSIVFQPRGNNGFGYDPLFELEDRAVTMGELTPAEKGKVSHRAKAIRALAEEMKKRFFTT